MKGKDASRKKVGKAAPTTSRVPSGIPGLDEMMEGGFVKNSTVTLRGRSGVGKTLFCLQYLYKGAMDHGEPGAFISFSESESEIYHHGKVFNWDLEGLTNEGKFKILRYEPHEVVKIIKEGGGFIGDIIESMGAKRLVLDSLTAYGMFFEHKYQANESILSLFDLLRKWNTTVLVTDEASVSPKADITNRVGFLTDGIIHLYYMRSSATRRTRELEIIKMRDTDHSDAVRLFGIEKNGLRVYKEVGTL